VLHTKSRQEKALATTLASMGITHYLPLMRLARYYGQRKVYVEAPVFPSYLFLWSTPEQAYLADQTKRVVKILRVENQRKLEWEIANLRMALSHDTCLLPHPFIERGARVEVRSGPFRGLQGVVDRHKSNDLLILQVESFWRAVSLEIDASLLEVIDYQETGTEVTPSSNMRKCSL
jgi:transcription antitermination factor NusG